MDSETTASLGSHCGNSAIVAQFCQY